jgi:hypothetical protein
MKTQVSPDRHNLIQEAAPEAVAQPAVTPDVAVTAEPDTIESAPAATEETKPLSPQFAALAKQRREIQLERQKLDAEKAALTTSADKSLTEYRERIKANALSVLMEEGVTYDQLTEQILASNQGSEDVSQLKAEIKAIKESLENQTKSLSEKDQLTEKRVLAQTQRDVDALVAEGDDYEMIREAGYAPKVVELIHRTYKETGEILDNKEAANLIEAELLEESLKFARIKKVQSQLNPVSTGQRPPLKQEQAGTKLMRTLTNRDGASTTSMSKRERAIAAMEGRLK